MIEVGGVPFLFDPFTAAVMQPPLEIHYNEAADAFFVTTGGRGAGC